jgi:hypothetical protein
VPAVEEPRSPGERDDLTGDLPVAQRSLMAMTLSPDLRTKDGAGAAIEGLTQAIGEYKMPLGTWSVPVLVISGLAILIFVLAFWLNLVTGLNGASDGSWGGLVKVLLYQTRDQAQNTLSGLGEVMAAVLGLALTVSSIIVQLAATRFTPHITSLFFRARTNQLILGFFVTATVFVVWVNFSIGDEYVPRWGVLFSMLLMTASLLLLFPYFAYVFFFLDPEKIIGRITTDGLYACTPLRGSAARRVELRQMQATEAVEHLTNIGLNALQQKDKNIASSAIDALCKFVVLYGETKAGMTKDWFRIPASMRQSPDFVSLPQDAIADLNDRGTWLEWKVLRQYQMLFSEGLTQIKDVCYLIAIDTRRLGGAAAHRSDLKALDLTVKFFNTYLRAAINGNDVRTLYNILHQYRQLGEMVLHEARDVKRKARSKGELEQDQAFRQAGELEARVIECATRMRYYSSEAFKRGGGMIFIAGVIAHDIGTLTAEAFKTRSACHDTVLRVFLGVDDATESADKRKTLQDVRLAQIKLATVYLVADRPELAKQVADDMRAEDHKRLRGMWHELSKLAEREFWEVNDRGVNFNWLTPAQKAKLPQFFGWFEGFDLDNPGDDSSLVVRP